MNIMNLYPGEQHAVDSVLKAGEMYGYGNMIAHLKKTWAELLRDKWDLDEESALRAADTSAYPLSKKQ